VKEFSPIKQYFKQKYKTTKILYYIQRKAMEMENLNLENSFSKKLVPVVERWQIALLLKENPCTTAGLTDTYNCNHNV